MNMDALAQEPCTRTSAELSAILELLQKVPLFAELAAGAQDCIATHAILQVLSDGVEIPSCDEDNNKLYAVIFGNVSLVHGDPSHPGLQQLLQATIQRCTEDVLSQSAAVSAESGMKAALITANDSCSSATGIRPAGVWQQVRQAASAGQNRLVHSSWPTRGQSPTGISRPISSLSTDQLQRTGPELSTNTELLASCVSVQAVKTGATFCGHQFPVTPPVIFTAAAGYSSEDAPQLSQLPNSCLAAVADPNSTAALLVVSKAAFMEAMRLHHEHHVSRLLDMACRIPYLRHTPIKELHKLAAHMQETTYSPGQVLLQQGKEVTDVHFLVSGTVQLTYIPPPAHQQQMPGAEITGIAAEPSNNTVTAVSGSNTSKQLVAALRAQAQQSPVVLGTRGPGWVLGDDAMRERRIAVTVAAKSHVVTLKVAPQKLLCALDPLTLRLFGRLRQQQPAEQQQLIQTALNDTIQPQQPPPQQQLRTVVLDQVYETVPKPVTILRPGDVGYQQLQDQELDGQKPPWQSIRGKGHSSSSSQGGAVAVRGARRGCAVTGPVPSAAAAASSPAVTGVPRASGDVVTDELQQWAERLPKGLTLDKCAGLSKSVSVVLLVGLIADIESSRRLEANTPTPLADKYNQEASSHECTANPGVSGDSAAGHLVHTELLESCGVAVLQIRVLPGQAPISGPALAGALDDVAAAWAAVTHDEGLQLIRWSASSWLMIGLLEPGASKRAGLEGLAGAVLSAAVRLSGVISRSTDILPVVGLAAGIASGSCFVQYEAGNFVTKVSGRAYDAATELCSEAATSSALALPHSHSSKDSSVSITLVTDGVAAMLQSSFWLEPCGGSSLLVSARPVVQPSPGSRSGSPVDLSQSPGRQTLGPGRNTIIGMGAGLLNPTTPKTPGGGLLLPNWGKAQNERRQMRRKFEALQDLLAGAGDTLPPPPDHMLTQPPPVAGARAPGVNSASGTSCITATGGGSVTAGAHAVSFSPAGDLMGSCHNSPTSGAGSKKGFKPRLTISVDGGASSAEAASPDEAATPGTNINCRTSGSTSLNRAGSRSCAGQDVISDSLLTPTLVMDSPWSGQHLHTATDRAAVGRLSVAALSVAQARLAGSRCSTPSSSGSRKQSQAGTVLGARQSIRQQVWQEVQELREGDRQIPSVTATGRCMQCVGTPPMAADHLPSSTGGSSSKCCGNVTDSGDGARCAPHLAGASGVRGTLCLKAKSTKNGFVDVVPKATGDMSAGGGRLKVTFKTPRQSQNCPVTTITGGNGNGGKPGISSSDGCLQQHRWSRKFSEQAHVASQLKQQQPGTVCSNDGRIECRSSGSDSGQKGGRVTGAAAALLGSSNLLLRSSLASTGGDCCNGGGTQLHQGQQQVQLEPACSDMESLNSMSLYPSDADISSSRSTAAATAAAQLEQLRHQATVMSACKALGSYAAAKNYVAALPDGLMAVNLSTAGLSHLLPLTRLTQLGQLSASFNKLDSLPALIPADVAAVAAAAGDTDGSSSSSSSSSSSNDDNTGSSHVLKQLTCRLLSGAASALPATLTRLGLAHNKLEQVPLELPAALPRLTELDLSHNQLVTLPTTFGALSCLKLLFLDHNKLASLPGSFRRLYSLQTLNLSYNCLHQLPSNLQQLQSLVRLQVQHNQLQQLPLGIANLSGLKSLGLGYNRLSSCPQGWLLGLSGLTSLDLAGNGFEDWQLEAAAAAAAAAGHVDVQQAAGAGDQLEQQALLPVEAAISESDAVTTVLPAPDDILPALQVLDLSHNQLQRLPAWLPGSLQRLSVSCNRITEVSSGFCCKLRGLTLLDLHGNQLTAVPQELIHQEHLQLLALAGNPGLDCEVVAAEELDRARFADKSDRASKAELAPFTSKNEKMGGRRSERSICMGQATTGMAWVYKWMMQRKSTAAATILRIVQQQRQGKQRQVAGVMLKGLLPGIRQTVIVDSGRTL